MFTLTEPDFTEHGANPTRPDDQGLSFSFCCGSAGSKLQSFTSLLQCHILKGTLELKMFPTSFQMLFAHQTEGL